MSLRSRGQCEVIVVGVGGTLPRRCSVKYKKGPCLINCKICGVLIKRIKTKANRNGKCRQRCDGIQRNKGGYPLDPILKKEYISKLSNRKTRRRVLDRSVIIRKPSGLEIKKVKRVVLDTTFYLTKEWQQLRYLTLGKYDRKCMVCFRTNLELHVDHIKPISKFPELALDPNNLQVLCRDCNLGKGNKDCIDWRPFV